MKRTLSWTSVMRFFAHSTSPAAISLLASRDTCPRVSPRADAIPSCVMP